MTKSDLTYVTYLGDGVYAGFDGHQIWLAVNQSDFFSIALDRDVTRSFAAYAHSVWSGEKP